MIKKFQYTFSCLVLFLCAAILVPRDITYAQQLQIDQKGIGYRIDLLALQEHRLEKINQERRSLGLTGYIYSSGLRVVAQARSDYSMSIGTINHQKYGSKAYYDYKLIQKYAESFGIRFSSVPGTKTVENIGWGVFRCDSSAQVGSGGYRDCTSAAIAATEQTRTFFMNEKGKVYSPHYKSMIHPTFTRAGFGLALDPTTRKYYFTAYYAVDHLHSPPLKRNPAIRRKKSK